ncbi:hypothetical protein EIP86_001993 [Pleurotus ostreatoroseus]|nr:hypothetical protein EIP86_001993 [Pleurotus ostreatoroseus]
MNNVIRPEGLLERYHTTRCQLGFDSGVVVSARYASGEPLTKAHIYGALKYAISQQANLGVQIDVTQKVPVFTRLPSVDLSRVVTIAKPSENLKDVFDTNFRTQFETGTENPLWRVAVLPDNTVAFAYHHAIADGQSGLAFHRSFLAGLNQLSYAAPEGEDVVAVPTNLSMEPPAEQLTNTSVSFWTLLRTIFGLFAPVSWTAGASAWTGNPVINEPSLVTNVHLWETTPADSAAFLRVCKSHKTTLTGAYHTIGTVVLSRVLSTMVIPKKYKTIGTSVAVSMRRFTGTSPEAMCDQASAIYTNVPFLRPPPDGRPGESFPWSAAVECSNRLRNGLSKCREVIGLIKFLFYGNPRDYWFGQLGKKRERTLEYSNLGRLAPSKDKGEWEIESMFFGQCDSIVGSAMKISIVGSPSGAVNTVFTWGEGAMDDAVADAFIAGFKAEFSSLLSQDPDGKLTV